MNKIKSTMHINLKSFSYLFLLFSLSYPGYSISLRDIKKICRKAPNYTSCMKDFSKKKYSNKKDKYTVINGPVPIKIIPYKER